MVWPNKLLFADKKKGQILSIFYNGTHLLSMNDQDSLGSALRTNLVLTFARPALDPSFRTRAGPGPTRSLLIPTEYIFSLFYCYLYSCIRI